MKRNGGMSIRDLCYTMFHKPRSKLHLVTCAVRMLHFPRALLDAKKQRSCRQLSSASMSSPTSNPLLVLSLPDQVHRTTAVGDPPASSPTLSPSPINLVLEVASHSRASLPEERETSFRIFITRTTNLSRRPIQPTLTTLAHTIIIIITITRCHRYYPVWWKNRPVTRV